MKQYVEINVIREQIGERFGFPVEDAIEILPIANDVQENKYCKMIPQLLEDARSLLGSAFFADYKLQNKADEVIARIDTILKAVKEK